MIGQNITRGESEAIEAAYRRVKVALALELDAREAHKNAKQGLGAEEDGLHELLRTIYEPNLFNGKVDKDTGEVT